MSVSLTKVTTAVLVLAAAAGSIVLPRAILGAHERPAFTVALPAAQGFPMPVVRVQAPAPVRTPAVKQAPKPAPAQVVRPETTAAAPVVRAAAAPRPRSAAHPTPPAAPVPKPRPVPPPVPAPLPEPTPVPESAVVPEPQLDVVRTAAAYVPAAAQPAETKSHGTSAGKGKKRRQAVAEPAPVEAALPAEPTVAPEVTLPVAEDEDEVHGNGHAHGRDKDKDKDNGSEKG